MNLIENSGQVALIGMKIHYKLRSTDALFLFLTFRLPNDVNFYSFCFCFSEGSLLFTEETSRFGRQKIKNKNKASVERSL